LKKANEEIASEDKLGEIMEKDSGDWENEGEWSEEGDEVKEDATVIEQLPAVQLEDKNELEVFETFESMGLNGFVLDGINSHGFERPSLIQQKAIVPISRGRDALMQSQSGTGKTGTFLISAMNRIDPSYTRKPQVMILSPTRELAEQTNAVALSLGGPMGLKTHLCIGGTRVLDDIDALRRGVHMVIGTPGRLLGLLHGRKGRAAPLDASRLKSWIVDEADEMFREKFELDMRDIYRFLPNSCQVVICSATMDDNVMSLAENICRDPIKVLVKKEDVALDGIQQYYVQCEEDRWKPGVLIDLWEMLSIEQTIVFVNSKQNAEYLCEALTKEGHAAECIHSGQDCDRDGILRKFKAGTIRVLVATDLLARGIDIQTISTVINVDLPRDTENYIHRIGRCGRFGRKGVSINLVNRREEIDLDRLRRHYDCEIKSLPEDLSKVFGQ